MRVYSQPFKRVFWVMGILSVVMAIIEVWLLGSLGCRVNILTQGTPEQVWVQSGTELILVAIFLLTLRHDMQAFHVLSLNQNIMPNFGTLVRWRAHRQVLRQLVGWFEDDFAGRIANRIMETPPAEGEVVFQVFDALTFSVAYLMGAMFSLGCANIGLVIPLLIWFSLYAVLLRWVVGRVTPHLRPHQAHAKP